MSDRPSDEIGRLIEWLDTRALPVLERIATALERGPMVATPLSTGMSPRRDLAEVRAAIDSGEWTLARSIVRDLTIDRPGDPGVVAVTEELARARQFAAEDLRQRIEAARQANDPEGGDRLARRTFGHPRRVGAP